MSDRKRASTRTFILFTHGGSITYCLWADRALPALEPGMTPIQFNAQLAAVAGDATFAIEGDDDQGSSSILFHENARLQARVLELEAEIGKQQP
ncbi:MAG TPA: hypothetical protein VM223_24790 [Planctomycetota bacterium]|nr:hypothetical protein [Planctomycetota bacterium]